MKQILILLTTLCSLSAVSQGRTLLIENQNVVSKTGVSHILRFQGEYIPKKVFGVALFGMVTSTFSEGFIGLTTKVPAKKVDALELFTGIGVENAPIPVRAQATLYLKRKFFSTFIVFEYGGSGYAYVNTNMFSVHPNWRVGTYLERYIGVGPRVEHIHKQFTFYVSPLYDYESKEWRGTLGANVLF